MKKLILINCLLLVAAIIMNAPQNDFAKQAGPYLGQNLSGDTPDIFSPAVVSSELHLEGVDSESDADIVVQLLDANKKIIPLYYRYDRTWITNIKLPVIVVTNQVETPTVLTNIDVIGKCNGQEVARNLFNKIEIDSIIKETCKLLNRLTSDPDNPWQSYNLKKRFGRASKPRGGYQENNKLKRYQTTAIDLSSIYHFLYEGPAKVDEILIQIKGDTNGEATVLNFKVPLTPYTCKGNYIFPVKGSVVLTAMPMGNGHRSLPSSEFAFGIIDAQRLPGGELSSSAPKRSDNVKDYFIFGRDVLAIGDGEIVAIGDKWPDKWVENPLKYSIERITDLTSNLIRKNIEFENAYLGNYVIIDHQNGEFSAYVHLSENSTLVKPGDKVKQGQKIAKVGNTANSTEPHLHFQLMDGKDYASSNGLPAMFKDVPSPLELVSDFAEVNSLIYSDYLFLFIK